MAIRYRESLNCSPSRAPGSYIYSILQPPQETLLTLSSADELILLDKSSLKTVLWENDKVPKSVTCLQGYDKTSNLAVCAGRGRDVSTFDVRNLERISHFVNELPVTSLDVQNYDIAVGSEAKNAQAVISVWESRQNRIRWKTSENHDDITDLKFDSVKPSNHQLLSGGDDGMFCLWDTNISNEEDSLIQANDYAPVHKVGFLSERNMFCLSSDQRLWLRPRDEPETGNSLPNAEKEIGDVRLRFSCDYVVDIVNEDSNPKLIAGSNLSQSHIDIHPMENLSDGAQGSKSLPFWRLEGAHGEEIVRSVCQIDHYSIFTAGEDGKVRLFNPISNTDMEKGQTEQLDRGNACHSTKKWLDARNYKGRYRPY